MVCSLRGDDRSWLKEVVKTYLMAPVTLLSSPSIFLSSHLQSMHQPPYYLAIQLSDHLVYKVWEISFIRFKKFRLISLINFRITLLSHSQSNGGRRSHSCSRSSPWWARWASYKRWFLSERRLRPPSETSWRGRQSNCPVLAGSPWSWCARPTFQVACRSPASRARPSKRLGGIAVSLLKRKKEKKGRKKKEKKRKKKEKKKMNKNCSTWQTRQSKTTRLVKCVYQRHAFDTLLKVNCTPERRNEVQVCHTNERIR